MSDSDSVSAEDPFAGNHTDSDEEYTPENEVPNRHNLNIRNLARISTDSSDSEVEAPSTANTKLSETPHKGKKRLQRRNMWTRNIRKQSRIHGDEYVGTSGAVVQKKELGPNCECRLKCFQKIDAAMRKKIFDDFYSIPSKELQDSYLYGLIILQPVARHRPRSGDGYVKHVSYNYLVSKNVNYFSLLFIIFF